MVYKKTQGRRLSDNSKRAGPGPKLVVHISASRPKLSNYLGLMNCTGLDLAVDFCQGAITLFCVEMVSKWCNLLGLGTKLI
jgi:hypothetical protein